MAVVDVDLINCFGMFTWPSTLTAVDSHWPELTPRAAVVWDVGRQQQKDGAVRAGGSSRSTNQKGHRRRRVLRAAVVGRTCGEGPLPRGAAYRRSHAAGRGRHCRDGPSTRAGAAARHGAECRRVHAASSFVGHLPGVHLGADR